MKKESDQLEEEVRALAKQYRARLQAFADACANLTDLILEGAIAAARAGTKPFDIEVEHQAAGVKKLAAEAACRQTRRKLAVAAQHLCATIHSEIA